MAPRRTIKKETAASMANKNRDISVSEFFAKNRHLLGFDNPIRALLTAVREGVDNSLDACEEAGILPDIQVVIKMLREDRFEVSIEDNGPGILKSHLANIFGKLLYGSKFHRLKQSRGQQGIGISAAVMYAQMTTGKSAIVISKVKGSKKVSKLTLQIDTKKNVPKIVSETPLNDKHWDAKKSGTYIGMTMEGAYKGSRHGVLAYVSQTALSNPHANFTFIDPKGKVHRFPRLVDELPEQPEEIKPHPHGVELGNLISFLHDSRGRTVSGFLQNHFCRVSALMAKEICRKAKVKQSLSAIKAGREEAESLYKAIQDTKLLPPPTGCLSPMEEDSILKALYWLFVQSKNWADEEALALSAEAEPEPQSKARGARAKKSASKQAELNLGSDGEDALEEAKEVEGDEEGSIQSEEDGYFVTAVTRPPAVYRGNPFQIEVGLFYGGSLKADALAQCYRFANRVPLQYQASACAMTKSIMSVPWKSYGLQQSRGALPAGPLVVMVHMSSVWVPYTSESKEAVASYDEILKEMRLALMEAGRRLQKFIKRKRREADEEKKRSYIEKYLDPIGDALKSIIGFSQNERDATVANLKMILEKTRDKNIKLTRKAK